MLVTDYCTEDLLVTDCCTEDFMVTDCCTEDDMVTYSVWRLNPRCLEYIGENSIQETNKNHLNVHPNL